VVARRDWLSTAQIAEEAGVHPTTLQRWAKQGLLPTPTLLSMGRKGRFHRWPPESLEQARWVKARVDELWTIDEIHEALERGDFKPTLGERQNE
jgi:DNA-binding transcriptional MerR regulator